MSYSLKFTPDFTKAFKKLSKRHRSLKDDFKSFSEDLKQNPFQGVELSPGIRKIRLSITSKGKGKSGGARVITYTVVATERDGVVYFMNIYDKSDFETIDTAIIQSLIKEMGLE